ncbi:MAG TPA: four helix bundle protein [Pyrinomonadaceae bacterium]|jgi:four helix bundle protein|nr:four helix bundle protein [Pyrinomonadaceae bacterium]
MERTNFEKLQVYQLSEKIADSIWNIVITWNPFARDTVGKQIVRAADSIGANIAEGSGRGSLVDNRRFVRMARGSLYEMLHWLRRCYMRKLLTQSEVKNLRTLVQELSPKLNAFLRSVDQRAKSR